MKSGTSAGGIEFSQDQIDINAKMVYFFLKKLEKKQICSFSILNIQKAVFTPFMS